MKNHEHLLFRLSLSGNKFLTSANSLMILIFRGGNFETWLGLTNVNTEGGSLALSLP